MIKSLLFLLTFSIISTALQAEELQRLLDPMPNTMEAQNFSLPTVSGEMQTLDQFKGSFVLVNFWSTKCQVCVAELAVLQDLYDQLHEEFNFEIIAIHAGSNEQGISSLLKINPVSYMMLVDEKLQMGHWGIPQLPTSYLVTPEGKFAFRAVGVRVWNAPNMVDFLREVMNGYESATSL